MTKAILERAYSLNSNPLPFWKYRLALVVSMVLIVPLGYWVRFAEGEGPPWLHDALGSVAYEVFWILLLMFGVPTLSPLWAASTICIATCALEVLQLWQHPVLLAMRATLVGRLVLGNTFTWTDFPAYFVGSVAGWGWVRSLRLRYVGRHKLSHASQSGGEQ